MYLSDILSPDTVRVGFPGESKAAILDGVIDLLAGNPAVVDLDQIRTAVLEREKAMSTGVGKGLALPHAKTAGIRETVAALVVTQGAIPFEAIDGDPVRILFLLVGTADAKSQHIKILSRISRIMNRDSLRDRLLEAETAEDLLAAIMEGEQALLDD
jgi:mannitol/fructose-specific phosphotransferase system IIA component (Ntr-type)